MTYQDIRKLSWNIAVLGMLMVCFLVLAKDMKLTALSVYGAQDPKAEIRHQHRDARYNSTEGFRWFKRSWPMGWSKRHDGDHNAVDFTFVETVDLNDPVQVAALRTEMANERNKATCAADVTLRGEILKSRGVITDDDLLIYTVYTLLVTDVLRSGAQSQVKVGDTIEFTVPGGTAVVDGKKKVTFNCPGLAPLAINDQYVLNLKRDNEADDYFTSSYLDIYLLDEKEKVTRMDAHVWSFYAERAHATQAPADFDTLKKEIQSANCQ